MDYTMSNGYTGSDSASEAEQNHIEDSLALHRAAQQVNDNETGACECCGEDIPAARLRAIPNAKYCVHCQGKAELSPIRNVCRNIYVP